MATCLVYIRKSTNREDKQQTTIPQQTDWVNELLVSRPDLDVIWLDWRICEIPQQWYLIEAESAKEGWKPRTQFQKLVNTIKKFWVDYVIVWRVDRLSRNMADSAQFMELFNNNEYIRKWVIIKDDFFDVKSNKNKQLLKDGFHAAEKDNSIRSDTNNENQLYRRRKWNLSNKFPFWYKKSGDWIIMVDTAEAKLVRLAFEWTLKWCQWAEISRKFIEEWYKRNGGSIKYIVENTTYYWELEVEGELIPIKNTWYLPIISKPMFDEVQVYIRDNYRRKWKANPLAGKDTVNNVRYFNKMVFDASGVCLQVYEDSTIWNTFYKKPSKNGTYTISISEAKLFQVAETEIDNFVLPKSFSILIQETLMNRMETFKKAEKNLISIKEWKVIDAQQKIDNLLDLVAKATHPRLQEKYGQAILDEEDKKILLEDELTSLKNSKKDFEWIALKYASYFNNLPETYRKVSKKEKADILRGLGIYFIVWPDKNITMMWWDIKELFNF